MATKGKPIALSIPRPPKQVQKQPKPCPTCYAPMRIVDGEFACVRHGRPTRP